jgi:hypothetical protein
MEEIEMAMYAAWRRVASNVCRSTAIAAASLTADGPMCPLILLDEPPGPRSPSRARCGGDTNRRHLSSHALYSTFLKPCAGGISGKTSGNRGAVRSAFCAASVGVTFAIATATERLTLDATRHHAG